MLAMILKFFGGGIVGQVGKQINTAIKAKLDAKNSTERIAADENIATLNAQRDVLLSEQSNRLTRLIRPLIAGPFIIYLWKVIVWDMVLGLGSTPSLSEQLAIIMGVVIGAFFLVRPFEKRRK